MTSSFATATVSSSSASSIPPSKMAQLRQQAEDLEGIFLNTLLKEMFASIKGESSITGSDFAQETWRGMQAEQMANSLAGGGGIGLAEAILPDLIAAQEAAQNATASRGAM